MLRLPEPLYVCCLCLNCRYDDGDCEDISFEEFKKYHYVPGHPQHPETANSKRRRVLADRSAVENMRVKHEAMEVKKEKGGVRRSSVMQG